MRCLNLETVEELQGLVLARGHSGSWYEEILGQEMVLCRLEPGLALHT